MRAPVRHRAPRVASCLSGLLLIGLHGCASRGAANGGAANAGASAETGALALSPTERLAALAGREMAPDARLVPIDAPAPPGVDPQALLGRGESGANLGLLEAISAFLATPEASAAGGEGERAPEAPPQVDPDARRRAMAHYARGRAAALERQNLKAILELRRALELDPASPSVMRELARVYLRERNIRPAEELFERMLELHPDDEAALMWLGATAADAREFEKALRLLGRQWLATAGDNRHFRHDPGADAVAAHALALSLWHLGYDEAGIEAALACAAFPFAPELVNRSAFRGRLEFIYRQRGEIARAIGDAQCRLGRFEEALAAYAAAAEMSISDPGALPGRVIYCNLRLGRPFSAQNALLANLKGERRVSAGDVSLCAYVARHCPAIDDLSAAVRAISDSTSDDGEAARAAAALLPPEEARQLLRSFVQRRPRDVAAVWQLLEWLGRRSVDEPVDLTIELSSDHPDLAAAYAQRLATALPYPAQALDVLRERPPTPARCNVEARLHAGFGALGRAWDVCGEGLARWPEDQTLLMLRVDLAALLGEPALLAEALDGARDVDTPWSWVIRSLALRAVEDNERAAEAAARAARRDESGPDGLIALAEAQLVLASASREEPEMLRLAEEAAATARQAVARAPMRDEGYRVLAELYRPGGILASSHELHALASRLLQANPHSRLYASLAAQEAILQGRLELGLERLLDLCDSDPNDSDSLARAMGVWGRLGRLDDAERWLAERRARRPGDPLLLEHWVRLQLERRRGAAAIDLLRETIEREPMNMIARRLLHDVLEAEGRHAEAAEVDEPRLLARPEGVRRALALAALYARIERTDEALSHLRWIAGRADGVDLDSLRASITIAVALEAGGHERDELLEQISRAAIAQHAGAPFSVHAALLLALARLGGLDDGRFDTAAAALLDRVEAARQPSLSATVHWLRLAQGLVNDGHVVAAGRVLRTRLLATWPMEGPARLQLMLAALAADAAAGGQVNGSFDMLVELDSARKLPEVEAGQGPMSLVEALYEASTIYSIVGEDAGADFLLRQIVARSSDEAMALNNLGYMHLVSNGETREDEIQGWIVRAYELDQGDSNILDTLGWLRYRQGRFTDLEPADVPLHARLGAVTLIRQALEGSEEPSWEVLDHLGDALFRAGDSAGALDAWRRADAALSDKQWQEQMRDRLFRMQANVWGLLVADPAELYHRDFGSRLEGVRAKVQAVERSEAPPLAPTFAEIER